MSNDAMRDEVEVDVAIVGGGIAACWAAVTLRSAGYSTLLLSEPGMGGGQTAHSHVYIHGGHLYRKEATPSAGLGNSLITDLQWATRLWDHWLSESPGRVERLTAAPKEGIFGFPSEADARYAQRIWDRAGLTYGPASDTLPELFDASDLTAFRSVQAHCLDARAVISEMVTLVSGSIIPTRSVTFSGSPTGSISSVAVITDRGPIDIRCGAVALLAGAGNRGLLQRLPDSRTLPTIERGSFMLVLQGPHGVLPPLSGILNISDDDGLFLVSREEADSVCWLVSDACRIPDADGWVAYVKSELLTVFPKLAEHAKALKWGFYEAPKAELNPESGFDREVHSVRLEDVAPNAVAGWPIKLTLAPVLAQDVLDRIDSLSLTRRRQPSIARLQRPPVNPEKWRTVPLRSCDDWW